MIEGKCEEPGCTGDIEDGYCNVCGAPGHPHVPLRAPGARPPSTSVRATGVSTKLVEHSDRYRPQRRDPPDSARPLVDRRARQHLGAGITSVPSSPVPDPRSIVLANPEVAEDKRVCASCGSPVGRSRDGKPGPPRRLLPEVPPAVLVRTQAQGRRSRRRPVRSRRCIAHGGLGWIYLAQDRNVSDRYVVLKGLLNSGDKDALDAAVTERQFLAQVQHPLILEIYNFARFEGAGYIVMEYVGGESLKQILKDRMTRTRAATTRSRPTRPSRTSSRSSPRSRTCTRRVCCTATSSPTT